MTWKPVTSRSVHNVVRASRRRKRSIGSSLTIRRGKRRATVRGFIRFVPLSTTDTRFRAPARPGPRHRPCHRGGGHRLGIPEADQEMLFSRFFRATQAREAAVPGSGLGLSIAKPIAELHGAGISVSSVFGSGSTFRVDFPPPVGVRPHR
ncbi:MAG: ATP-binding protein [Terracoccus sp.]